MPNIAVLALSEDIAITIMVVAAISTPVITVISTEV